MPLLILVVFLFFSASQSVAQTGSITGLVTDQSGAVVPDATVTVIANTTGTTRDVITGSAGTYTLVNLQPTVYTLTVGKSGFEKAVLNDVNVTVGEVVPLNVKLQIGSATTQVNVSAITEARLRRIHTSSARSLIPKPLTIFPSSCATRTSWFCSRQA
jgi:hypothetical protein